MICYVRIRLEAESPLVTVRPFVSETAGQRPTPPSRKSITPIIYKSSDSFENPPVPFSLFSSHQQFDGDTTFGSMKVDSDNGFIKKDADAEGDVCNEELATDADMGENIQEDVDDQEDSTSEDEVEDYEEVDRDEQGNAASEETEKSMEANIKNYPDENVDIVSKKFQTEEFLKQNIRRKFVCHVCGKNNNLSEKELSEHIEECQKIKAVEGLYSVRCTMCKMQFGSFFKLRQHMKICNFLHHKLEKAKKQKKSVKIVVKQSKYKCNKCCLICLSEEQLFAHVCDDGFKNRTDPQDQPHQCKACGRVFESEIKLKVHSLGGEKILNTTKFRCFKCISMRTFVGWCRLTGHVNRIHDASKKSFVCEECGVGFKGDPSLRQHMIDKHDYPARFQCGVFAKGFYARPKFEVHERSHTGERPFQCELCGGTFKEKGKLKKHVERHNSERNHACHICGKKYTSIDSLKNHISGVHDRSKNTECPLCHKVLVSKRIFQAHMKLHNHQKKFKCEICTLGYSSISAFRAHKRKRHKDVL